MGKPVSVNSPCINVCVIDAEFGQCFGCFRTIHEISNWQRYSPGEKAKLLEDLERRRAVADPVE